MSDNNKFIDARIQAAECVTSLQAAIQEAGGSVMSVERMRGITLMQFITEIAAQNGLRFHYVGTVGGADHARPWEPGYVPEECK